jgi:hypothetical protein
MPLCASPHKAEKSNWMELAFYLFLFTLDRHFFPHLRFLSRKFHWTIYMPGAWNEFHLAKGVLDGVFNMRKMFTSRKKSFEIEKSVKYWIRIHGRRVQRKAIMIGNRLAVYVLIHVHFRVSSLHISSAQITAQ